MAGTLAVPVGATTPLRRIREAIPDPVPEVRVLGVDDWAWRKGRSYGTILGDLEGGRVIDLLADRKAETLAIRLRRHPGVEIVVRDRAGAYADGARQGAPQAIQVADRWHLLRNSGDALRAVLDRHHRHLSEAARIAASSVPVEPVANDNTADGNLVPSLPSPNKAERRSREARDRRHVRFEEAVRLRAQGLSIKAVAKSLGIERKTVRRWLRAGRAPAWLHADRGRSIAEQAFPATPPPKPAPPPTSRKAARMLMLMSEPDRLDVEERRFTTALLEVSPPIAETVSLAKAFSAMVRQGLADQLDGWISAAEESRFRGFARSLCRDTEAVRAALKLPWSTGPVEGQINRLKVVKRSMYGRAGFDLLRSRVMAAAWEGVPATTSAKSCVHERMKNLFSFDGHGIPLEVDRGPVAECGMPSAWIVPRHSRAKLKLSFIAWSIRVFGFPILQHGLPHICVNVIYAWLNL